MLYFLLPFLYFSKSVEIFVTFDILYFQIPYYRPHSCRAQLDKVGLGSDECKEILEGLLNIKYR